MLANADEQDRDIRGMNDTDKGTNHIANGVTL